MASRVAWLDASAEEQRRVREVVQLFAQKETQDELGGRRIVVALADELFPGTSVLHSRARYLLFIPWLCEKAARSKDPVRALDYAERELITSFKSDPTMTSDDLRGLIGIEAGAQVRQLPSVAYWTALRAWGILVWPGSAAETLDRMRHLRHDRPTDDLDELADRARVVWHHGVGRAPEGFPKENLDGGFRLKAHEAEWLRERLLETTGDSLLAHLVRSEQWLDPQVPAWQTEVCLAAPGDIPATLADAQRFSLAADGARRLYDLLVAEHYRDEGFDRVAGDVDGYVERLDDWVDLVRSSRPVFAGWDPRSFWGRVRTRNPNINRITQAFFDTWFDVAANVAGADEIVGDEGLRRQVADRESFLKGAQARLANRKMLAAWNGGRADAPSFRWPYVVQIVNDLVEGTGGGVLDAGA